MESHAAQSAYVRLMDRSQGVGLAGMYEYPTAPRAMAVGAGPAVPAWGGTTASEAVLASGMQGAPASCAPGQPELQDSAAEKVALAAWYPAAAP